jgi:glycine/D-amino acid oxidase-like deaminating enzyme/glycine cleavage system aminomethyltransferase T
MLRAAGAAPRQLLLRQGGGLTTQSARVFSADVGSSDGGSVVLPAQAQCVVVGGGVIGTSVAYHLAKAGWTDVVLLEQSTLTSGTTWHAAGLIGMLRATDTETKLSMYGRELYTNLEDETGLSTGFKQCGSVSVARTEDRLAMFRRNKARAEAYGIEAHVISPEECGERMGGTIATDDLVGGLWLPLDGSADPTMVTNSLAKGARQMGVQIVEGVRVTGFAIEDGGVEGVQTTAGDIKSKYVVNCAGQWARQLGMLAGVTVPLHSAEHYYMTTAAIDGITADTPVMRDPDAYTYFREWSGGLMVGGFEPECKPIFSEGVPDDFAFQLFDFDFDQFEILLNGAMERFPALESTEMHTTINGPESFTPDNQYIIGEAPNVDRFFVAAGMNSSGIASAGGVGKAIADWMVHGSGSGGGEGSAPVDLGNVDICRFGPFHGNVSFLRDRTVETLGLHYKLAWPGRELLTGRPLRRSPLYGRLVDKHAVFGNKFGWERPTFFAESAAAASAEPTYSWGEPYYFEAQKQEHLHTREHVSVFDQTSFSKYLVQGKDSLAAMQQLCAGDVDTDLSKLTYTGMLNEHGRYVADVTVTRLGEDEFMVVSGTAQSTRDVAWMRRQINHLQLNAVVTDVGSSYSVLGLMGPRARDVLSRAAPHDDVSHEGLPFGSSKQIGIGYALCRASRVTYVGELGWELYIPTEFALAVYDELFAHGEAFGLRDAGYYAIESMRVEKGYRAFGHELSPLITPSKHATTPRPYRTAVRVHLNQQSPHVL